MKHQRRALSKILLLACFGAPSLGLPVAAQDRGSKDEAKALNEAAVAHIKKVGTEQAAKDFATDRARWMPKDLYPFVMDFGGVMRFHINDKMIGKNMLDVKDASGKEFGKEMLSVARSKSTGWVDYEWTHPATKKIEDKSAFIQRVPGAELFVGVGIYR
jgi:cytochrome c